MELFDAVYGDAYAAVEKVLETSPLSPRQLHALLNMYMTPNGASDAEAKLIDGTWPLLRSDGHGMYESVLPPLSEMPLTFLQLRWLKSLCDDERAPLFLTDSQLDALREALHNIPPLFQRGDIESFDSSRAGDSFRDPTYRQCFHSILQAFR